MDGHVRWSRYGQGSTPAEKVASVERAFPYATAVMPMPWPPPLPPQSKAWWNQWIWY